MERDELVLHRNKSIDVTHTGRKAEAKSNANENIRGVNVNGLDIIDDKELVC